jgi:tetratricopeptide (TPR) repeat protein
LEQRESAGVAPLSLGIWVFVAAAVVRIVYLILSVSSPVLYAPSPDESFYLDFARSLLDGNVRPEQLGFMDPLLGYVLAALSALGLDVLGMRVVFLLIDAANAWLLYRLVLGIWGRTPALIAGLGYAFYIAALMYSIFLTKSTLSVMLLLLGCLALAKALLGNDLRWLAGCGVAVALLIPLRAQYSLLALLFLPAVALYFRARWLLASTWYTGALVTTVVLFSGLQLASTGQSQLMPDNGGVVLYISNHADNREGTHLTPDFVRSNDPLIIQQDFKAEAERREQRELSDKEVSRYWQGEILSLWRELPMHFFRLTWQRTRQWLNNDEHGVNYWLEHIHTSTLGGAPLIPFALILSLGVSGLYLASLTTPLARVFWLPVIVCTATGLVFFVMSRLRLPMVPFLLAGAAYWWVAWKECPGKQRAFAAAVGLLLLASSLLPSPVRVGGLPAQLNLLSNTVNAGMLVEAERLAGQLLSQHPESSRAWFLMGNALLGQERCVDAIAAYERALELRPELSDASYNSKLCSAHLMESD